jgi:hypothetical protein
VLKENLKTKRKQTRVAAMSTVAHNTIKQLSVNAKINFSLLLPYA